jgi:hopene-associated glycosyltransferase HpnB
VIAAVLGAACLGVWAYLLFGRGGFWRTDQRDEPAAPDPAAWPSIAAVMPARDEADVIARSIGGLLRQDYPGDFRVILVDDDSGDGTAAVAIQAARSAGLSGRLEVVRGAPLPPGWTGKLWAVSQGVARAGAGDPAPTYLLLTDADIGHSPDLLRTLVARAESQRLVLTSLMAELHCATFAEKLLVPAFVFFFQMVYPFRWVNRPGHRIAGAAGGCMLVRREALAAAGGIAAIRGALIDDCSLAALMKRQGPIWLGLTRRSRSLRPYPTLGDFGRMVARSAFAQLDYSAWLLAGTLVGLFLTYLLPPLLTLFGHGPARWAGLVAWLAMAAAFQPMLRFYRRSPLWGLALPLIAAFYAAFTLQSAIQVWRGRGGMWKGRSQALAGAT